MGKTRWKLHSFHINCATVRFSSWYAKQVSEALGSGMDISSVKVNLAISVIKPLHAKWLMHVITAIAEKQDTIINGFDKAGISSIFLH